VPYLVQLNLVANALSSPISTPLPWLCSLTHLNTSNNILSDTYLSSLAHLRASGTWSSSNRASSE
jgi:hypothetical protein